MSSAIITTHYRYRYKRPPRKRKPVVLEVPAIVTTKNSRRPVWGETAAEVPAALPPFREEGAVQPSTPREATRVAPPANDDPTSAIVTARRPGKQFRDAPDLTLEEQQRRGEAADALWRELVRRATANLFLAATMALTLCNVSGCASTAAYEASHPPYRFPKSYVGGGG